jgi:bifunctional aspartokinase / homoserine dehydrogenase 1
MSTILAPARIAPHQQKPSGRRTASRALTDVVLLGVGAIGRELLGQIGQLTSHPNSVRVCGVIDSSGYLFDARGFSKRTLASIRSCKARGGRLTEAKDARHTGAADALSEMCRHGLSHPVLVDATTADTTAALAQALEHGWNIVLANKVPLAAEQTSVDRLLALAASHGAQVRHEATVGAGLPVIDTLYKLLDSGDRVFRIEGCPSGTLGFLFSELGRGRRFSDALRDAIAAGYTEPDPRVDLSGLDVARKALILARLLGFRGDASDIPVRTLVPDALRTVPLPEFLARVEELDAPWEARVQAARKKGKVWRYRISVGRRSIRVGLVAVPAATATGALTGTDNQFAFTTARYRERPLVITGPGAGPAVTAAGVLNDILCLSSARSRSPDERRI